MKNKVKDSKKVQDEDMKIRLAKDLYNMQHPDNKKEQSFEEAYKPSDEFVFYCDYEFYSSSRKDFIDYLVFSDIAPSKEELEQMSNEELLKLYEKIVDEQGGPQQIGNLNTYKGLVEMGNEADPWDDEEIEDSKKVQDEEQDDVTKVCKLLAEAHDKIMEALDLVEELENEEILSSNARYDLEDLEASASDFDFTGEADPRAAFMEKYEESSDGDEYPDDDDMYD